MITSSPSQNLLSDRTDTVPWEGRPRDVSIFKISGVFQQIVCCKLLIFVTSQKSLDNECPIEPHSFELNRILIATSERSKESLVEYTKEQESNPVQPKTGQSNLHWIWRGHQVPFRFFNKIFPHDTYSFDSLSFLWCNTYRLGHVLLQLSKYVSAKTKINSLSSTAWEPKHTQI